MMFSAPVLFLILFFAFKCVSLSANILTGFMWMETDWTRDVRWCTDEVQVLDCYISHWFISSFDAFWNNGHRVVFGQNEACVRLLRVQEDWSSCWMFWWCWAGISHVWLGICERWSSEKEFNTLWCFDEHQGHLRRTKDSPSTSLSLFRYIITKC